MSASFVSCAILLISGFMPVLGLGSVTARQGIKEARTVLGEQLTAKNFEWNSKDQSKMELDDLQDTVMEAVSDLKTTLEKRYPGLRHSARRSMLQLARIGYKPSLPRADGAARVRLPSRNASVIEIGADSSMKLGSKTNFGMHNLTHALHHAKCNFPICVKSAETPIPDPGMVDAEAHEYAEDVLACERDGCEEDHADCEETPNGDCRPKKHIFSKFFTIDWSACEWAAEAFAPDPCSHLAPPMCELLHPRCDEVVDENGTRCVRNETAFPKPTILPPASQFIACIQNKKSVAGGSMAPAAAAMFCWEDALPADCPHVKNKVCQSSSDCSSGPDCEVDEAGQCGLKWEDFVTDHAAEYMAELHSCTSSGICWCHEHDCIVTSDHHMMHLLPKLKLRYHLASLPHKVAANAAAKAAAGSTQSSLKEKDEDDNPDEDAGGAATEH